MDIKFSAKLKNEIYNLIIKQKDPFSEASSPNGILNFLSKIWDLRSMPSSDERYTSAFEDTFHHTVNNNDWDYQFIFFERFNLFKDNLVFQKFIEAVIHPEIRKTEDDIQLFFFLINPYLENENYSLVIADYNELELPIYKISTITNASEIAIDFKQNSIHFFVELNFKGRSYNFDSHNLPSKFPSFVLVHNKEWNDYSVMSDFSLFYYQNKSEQTYIGQTKIIYTADAIITSVIPVNFQILDNNFCSLGQDINYYNRLKELLGKDFKSILWALKDAAFFSNIQEKFENEYNFRNSLIRYDEQERLLREVKYKIYDYDLKKLYSFKYIFHPKFSKNSLNVDFNFENNNVFSNRIYAIIGKNGTGKTQLMTSLPIDLYKKKDEQFIPNTPLFSKVIAVSYSAFDTFETPKTTASFNYLYCGLKGDDGERISNRSQILRFHISWKRIKTLGRMQKWIKILQNFIEQEIIDEFIENDGDNSESFVNLNGFKKTREILSSGQSIILYIITEIVANIRYDSIILYDEPETHLHPNAISQLMNTIYELVNEFQSYCIIATHSPLIIRELLSKNVFVIERDGDIASVRKIGIESFGENLTVLTDEVFGNRSIPKQYKLILQKMINSGLSIEDIIVKLESDGIPLSLNASIYLNSLVNEES